MATASLKRSRIDPTPLTRERLLEIFILGDLGKLQGFANEVEDFLEGKLREHEAQSEQLTASQSEATKQIQMMFLAGGLQKYGSNYPDILRYSLFIHAFAQWEHSLEVICNHLHENRGLALSQKDLNGDAFSRAKIYLSKVACVGFPKKPTTIEAIRVLGHIRNLIVHVNGVIPESYDKGKRQAIVAFLKNQKCGSIINDVRVHLERDFGSCALNVFKTFWREFFATWKQ